MVPICEDLLCWRRVPGWLPRRRSTTAGALQNPTLDTTSQTSTRTRERESSFWPHNVATLFGFLSSFYCVVRGPLTNVPATSVHAATCPPNARERSFSAGRGETTARPHRERSTVLAVTTCSCKHQLAKLNKELNLECKRDMQLCLFTS